jgi:hypothetical protein
MVDTVQRLLCAAMPTPQRRTPPTCDIECVVSRTDADDACIVLQNVAPRAAIEHDVVRRASTHWRRVHDNVNRSRLPVNGATLPLFKCRVWDV